MLILNSIYAQVDPRTVGDLTESAESLARTTNEVGVYNMIAGLFFLVFLIMFVYQMWSVHKLTAKMSVIAEASMVSMQYFQDKMLKSINLDQARSEIEEQCEKSAAAVKFQIFLMKERNHIDDHEGTEGRVKKFITNLYNDRLIHLKKFEYRGKNLSDIMTIDSSKSIAKIFLELLYLPQDQFKLDYISRQVEDFYDGLRADYNDKIDKF